MENKRGGLDDFFKENLSELELSEKKGNWELLNHLLNQQERKKKNRKWFLLFFCFLALVSTGVFVFISEKKSNTNSEKKSNQITAPSKMENKLFKTEKEKSSANTQTPLREIEKNEINNASNNATAEVKYSDISKNSKEENSETANDEMNQVATQSDISVNDSDHSINPTSSNSEPNIQSPANNSQDENVFNESTTNQVAISTDTLSTKSIVKDSVLVITKNNPPVDSVMFKQNIPIKPNFISYNFFVGANIYSANSAFTNHEKISPFIGLEFSHSISSKLKIGLAGWYSFQKGYNLRDTISKESFFLERNISQQTIQIRQLDKLYFPLTVYYSVAKKHAVLGAVQLSYLLNTVGNFSEIHHSSGSNTVAQKNNVRGYMDGINSTNIAVSLGYKYKLSNRFEISARMSRDLIESYTKEYFYGVNSKPLFSFQSFLSINF